MATIQEIEQRAADMRSAEARALYNLAEHLRGAVIDLPVESQLAAVFVTRAKTFETAARSSRIFDGKQELSWSLRQDIDEALGDARPSKAASHLLREAAELVASDRLVAAIERIARHVDAWGGLD